MLLKFSGVRTNRAEAQPGGVYLDEARNVLLDANGQASPRPGIGLFTASAAPVTPAAIAYFGGGLVVQGGTATAYSTGGAWTSYAGTFAAPDSETRARFLETRARLYLASSTGLRRLESLTGAWVNAGLPRPLNLTVALVGTSGFLANGSGVAYETVIGVKLASGQIVLGPPSGRVSITNSAGASRDVAITQYLPSGLPATAFLHVYRTAQIAGVPTGDRCLVYESPNLSGASVAITDSAPDVVRGEPGYWCETQDGPYLLNERPPLARDMVELGGSLLLGDVTDLHRLSLRLLAVGAPAFQVGDTITIAGVVYTAAAAENVATNSFLLQTSGTASANIQVTAESLVSVINRSASNTTVYAHYVSGEFDAPGSILVEARTLGAASFAAIASARGTSWNPPLPTAETSVSSTDNAEPGAVAVSKYGEHEAFPALSRIYPGRKDARVRRMVLLNEEAHIFKDDGYFIISGTDGDFSVREVDPSFRVVAPNSVAVLGGQIYALTAAGVETVSASGRRNISRGRFERAIDPAVRTSSISLATGVHGFALPHLDLYAIVLDDYPTALTYPPLFVYSAALGEWIGIWEVAADAALSAFVADAPRYYVAGGTSLSSLNFGLQRGADTYDLTDAVNIATSTGTSITISAAPARAVRAGDMIQDSAAVKRTVASVVSSTEFVMSSAGSATGAATVYRSIAASMTLAPFSIGNGSQTITEAVLAYSEASFHAGSVQFATDLSPSYESVSVLGPGTPGAGYPVDSDGQIRVGVPTAKKTGSRFRLKISVTQALGLFRFDGVEISSARPAKAVTR